MKKKHVKYLSIEDLSSA